MLGIVAFALLFLVALAFSLSRIQDDRAAFVEQQLRAAGLSGIEVDFSGRDGTMIGPAAQEAVALAAVKDRAGIRNLTYRTPGADDSGDAGGTTTTTAAGDAGAPTTVAPPAPTTQPAPAVQGLALASTVAGPGITLTGNVPAAADKEALVAAATAAYGAGKVVDQVQVIGGAWDAAGKKGFDGLRSYLSATGSRLRAGQANLTAGTIDANGTGFSNQAAVSLNQTLARIRAGGVPVNATIQDPAPAADSPALQAALNELLGRAGITFASASAAIDDRSKAVLDTAAQSILAGPATTKVEISGHTDSVGPEPENQTLSLQRAQAVRIYLVAKGVPAASLTARGEGSTRPVGDNATAEGRAQNRRIEFIVTGS